MKSGIKKRPFGFSGGAAFMLVFQCLSAQLPFSKDHEDKHHHSVHQCIVHSLEVPYDLVRCKEIVFRLCRNDGLFSKGCSPNEHFSNFVSK